MHESPRPPWAAAVIAHGLFSSMQSEKLTRLADTLAWQGCATLRFDHAGCGESPGEVRRATLTGRRDEYLAAARRMAEVHPGLPLVYLGSSLGGTAALLASRELPPACLALWSAPMDMAELMADMSARPDPPDLPEMAADLARHDLRALLARTKGALFVHGERDEVVPVAQARLGHRLAATPKALCVLPEADHRLSRIEHQLQATARTLEWIRLMLGR